jgi:hypothetical protein
MGTRETIYNDTYRESRRYREHVSESAEYTADFGLSIPYVHSVGVVGHVEGVFEDRESVPLLRSQTKRNILKSKQY